MKMKYWNGIQRLQKFYLILKGQFILIAILEIQDYNLRFQVHFVFLFLNVIKELYLIQESFAMIITKLIILY